MLDILMVDDEAEILESVGDLLRAQGFSVLGIKNSLEAIWNIEESHPSLVLCDISMPDLTGIELLSKIRMRGLRQAVVMLTAHSDHERVVEALRLGAIDYIVKPFDPKELLESCRSWIEIGKRMNPPKGISETPEEILRREKTVEMLRNKLAQLKTS